MKIRTAIVGTGHAARLHLAAARAAAPLLEIAAIGGRNRSKAEDIASTAGIPAVTPDEAVRSASFDAVILAVPGDAQPDLAIAAFGCGKHVLCEKPLAPSLDAARSIERAWRSAGTVGMVNFCYRLVPAIAQFRQDLDAGVCGDLSWIEARWVLASRLDPSLPFNWKADAAAGGGALRNFGSHVFDYLFHGKDVQVKSAWQHTLTASRIDPGGVDRTATADEVLTALFKVSGWCPVVVHISLITRPQLGHCLTARGAAGTLEVWNTSETSAAGPFVSAFRPVLGADHQTQPQPKGASLDLSALFEAVHSRFANAIAGGGDPSPGIEDGVRAAAVADAVSTAAQS